MSSMRRARFLVLFVVLVFLFNCGVGLHEAKAPEFFAIVYLGLSAFVGSYAQLEGQSDQPTSLMAAGLVSAILVTFLATLSMVLQMSRSRWYRWRAIRAKDPIVVVGTSAEAAAIAGSVPERDRGRLVRLHEPGSQGGMRALVLDHLGNFAGDRGVSQVIRRASMVVVAASTDALSASLASQVRELRQDRISPVRQLVRSAPIAKALRPRVLTALPDVETFHPADAVGQKIVELLRHWTPTPCRVQLDVYGDGGDATSEAVDRWLHNAEAAEEVMGRTFALRAAPGESTDVTIITGPAEQVAAAAALHQGGGYVIAVAPRDLVRTVCPQAVDALDSPELFTQQSGKLIVMVDPQRDGLEYRTVVEGIAHQWGRAFHEGHQSLYVSGDSSRVPSSWNSRVLGRNEQSSIAAARYMPQVLQHFGFHLEEGVAGWGDETPDEATLQSMARMEHEEWRDHREWIDPDSGARRRVSHRQVPGQPGHWEPGPNCVDFDELDDEACAYNLETVRRVYPSLAAMFGYGIRRNQSDDS